MMNLDIFNILSDDESMNSYDFSFLSFDSDVNTMLFHEPSQSAHV